MDARVKDELSTAASVRECAAPKLEASSQAVATPTPPLDCVFEGCVGGFVSGRSRFCLRISSSGDLRGEVWRRRPTTATAPATRHIGGNSSGSSGSVKRRRIAVLGAVKSDQSTQKSDEDTSSSRTATDDDDSPSEPATTAAAAAWTVKDHVLIAHVAGSAAFVKVASTSLSSSSEQGFTTGDDELKPDPDAVRPTTSGPQLFEYCCSFTITKRADHMDRHTVQCHLHIPIVNDSNDDPVVADGEWSQPFQRHLRSSSNPTIKAEATSTTGTISQPLKPKMELFKLTRVDPTTDTTVDTSATGRSLLYPLRPGKYDFQGFTTYETPTTPTPRRRGRPRRSATPPLVTKDECIVSLRLYPDGTLRGTSRELVHPQVCAVYGNWQVNRVIYILEYHVRDAVGRFRYSGGVDTTGEADKLVGKWRNVDEGHADGFEGGKGEFELGLVRAKYDSDSDAKRKRDKKRDVASNSASISSAAYSDQVSLAVTVLDDDEDVTVTALTCGHYRFKGEATDSDGYEYAFELMVTLLPGGRLEGACSERVFTQTRPVTGRWNRLSFAYQQEYVVRREVGVYLYAGELSPDGVVLQGHWRNAEAQYASVRSEHGTFALAMTSADRFWSTESHRDYSRGFRAAVRCLLLCSARSHVLPGALWTHVLAFCDEKWFVPGLRDDAKSVGKELELKPEVFV